MKSKNTPRRKRWTPPSKTSFLILSALKERGVMAESEDPDWVLGQQGNQGATALEQLQRFLQQNDRARLVRLAGKSEIAGQFLARVQSDQGYMQAGTDVLVGYADQPVFPRRRDWLRFAEVTEQGFWSPVWEATLLIRLYQSGFIPGLRKQKYAQVREQLASLHQREEAWNERHQAAALALATDWFACTHDVFGEVEASVREQGSVLWVVYHDLEALFEDDELTRREAVTGLFHLVQNRDARHHDALRPLIFLQESLWERLNFENKSHFTGRDLRL
jgi:hypothetical protein